MRTSKLFYFLILPLIALFLYYNDHLLRCLIPLIDTDGETVKEIKIAETILDASIKKGLANDLIWPLFVIPKQQYYDSQYSVLLHGMRVKVNSKNVQGTSNIAQMTLAVDVHAENIVVDGLYEIKASLEKQYGTFRSTIQNVICSGTGSLQYVREKYQLEWLLLDCPEYTPITIKVNPTSLFTSDYVRRDLPEGIRRTIEIEIDEIFSSLTSKSIEKVLKKTTSKTHSKLVRSPIYLNITQEEVRGSNLIADAAVQFIILSVQQDFNGVLKLPDLKEGIDFKLLRVIKLDTGLAARDGYAKDIESLERFGDARVVTKNDTLHFAGALQFRKLTIFYKEFQAAILGFGPKGTLTVTVEPVRVGLRLRVDFAGRKLYLDKFKIINLGKTEVEVGGLGAIIGPIVNEITNCFVRILKQQLMKIVEQRISTLTKKTLAKNSLDDIVEGNIKSKA